jgi:hypothetical protein
MTFSRVLGFWRLYVLAFFMRRPSQPSDAIRNVSARCAPPKPREFKGALCEARQQTPLGPRLQKIFDQIWFFIRNIMKA